MLFVFLRVIMNLDFFNIKLSSNKNFAKKTGSKTLSFLFMCSIMNEVILLTFVTSKILKTNYLALSKFVKKTGLKNLVFFVFM